ncbi:MAG: hypothetical protein PUB32_06120 [Clostridiales bacterium]|nr:hypothetical protein [Clostridiales bacterium]
MQSTRSFFNGAIFRKTVRRYWPMWAMYLLVWTLALCVCAKSSIRLFSNEFWSDDILEFTWMFGLFASLAASCLSAMLVHSWMYNARSASAYSALPVSRASMFCSITLAGIVPMIACNLIAAIAAWLVGLFNGFNIFLTVLQCFLVVSLECIFFFGLATFCATLTGHVFVLPVVYTILNFVVVVVEWLVKYLMSEFTFGAIVGGIQLDEFSPVVYLIEHVNVNSSPVPNGTAHFDSWAPFIIYALIGIVLAFIGLLIFRRRKMESASDVVAVKLLKPVFKYCFCFGCSLVIGIGLFELIFNAFFTTGNPIASVVICLCMLIGGFIGYFAAEMLMKKSFKVFRKSWKGYLISGAVIILFITVMETDVFGYERRIPAIENVRSAQVELWGEPTSFTDVGDIADVMLLHERIINNKAQTEKSIYCYYSDSRYRAYDSSSPYTLYISYQLDNGRTLDRRYTLLYNESDKFCADLLNMLNQPDAILSRINSTITPEYIENAYIYFHYNVPKEQGKVENVDENATYAVNVSEHDLTLPNGVNINISEYDDYTYIYGDLQLTARQARALFENAIMKDARNGDAARILIHNNGYKNKISVNIEFSARIPEYDYDDDYYYEYIYFDDITEDAKYTVAALKELGIDLEALASSAIE